MLQYHNIAMFRFRYTPQTYSTLILKFATTSFLVRKTASIYCVCKILAVKTTHIVAEYINRYSVLETDVPPFSAERTQVFSLYFSSLYKQATS
jgi:hypothetical protein